MDRQRLPQTIGVASLALLLLGAALYAINSPHWLLTRGLLGGGALLLVGYAFLNASLLREFARKRSSRHGANLAVMIVLFSCIVVIAQALSSRHSYRYDTTDNKRFSLAAQTVNILRSLRDDLRVYGFYTQAAENRVHAEDLLSQYAHHSPRFRYELIDPDRNPMRAADLDVENYGTIVLQYGSQRERISTLNEESLTNAMLRVTREDARVLYFVTGHGEKDINSREPRGASIMRDALKDGNYTLKTVSLFDEASVPKDCDVLVVAGPQKDYFDSELTKITDYLEPGGNAVLLLDAQVDLPNLEGLLSQYAVGLNNDVIIDPYSRMFGGEYTVPVVDDFVAHPITRDLDVATFFPMARSVRILETNREGTSVQYLATTGKSAWGERDMEGVRKGQATRDETDNPPPLPVALIASRRAVVPAPNNDSPGESKIVLVGDSDFVGNSYFRLAGNTDLFLNVINFLAEEKDLIAIRAKKGTGDRLLLTASQGRLIFLLCVILMPGAVISIGTTVFFRQRKKG